MDVKCLSVRVPWSYLLCFGIKDVENRTWTTKYRGEIYIHSSGDEHNGLIVPEYFSNMKEYKNLLPVHAEFVDYRDHDEPGKEYQILIFWKIWVLKNLILIIYLHPLIISKMFPDYLKRLKSRRK